MLKKYLIAITAILIFAAAGEAKAEPSQAAKDYVKNLSDKVLAVVKSTVTDDEKEKKLVTMFEQNVDTDFMAKFSMGATIRTLSPDQKKKYLSLYKDYVIYSYIPRFRMYSGESLAINQAIKEDESYYIVKSTIATDQSSTGSVMVDYKLKKTEGSFKLVDIIGEGISLITNHRSDFSAALANGDVDGFLTKLEGKVKDLKARSKDPEFIKDQYRKAKSSKSL